MFRSYQALEKPWTHISDLALYDFYLLTWRYIFSKQYLPVKLYQKDTMNMLQKLCNLQDQRLREILKDEIVSCPYLASTDPAQRFYINTYWSEYDMVEVLMKSDYSLAARKQE